MSQHGDFFLTLSQQNNKGHLKESNIDLANNIRRKHITTRKCTKRYYARALTSSMLASSPILIKSNKRRWKTYKRGYVQHSRNNS